MDVGGLTLVDWIIVIVLAGAVLAGLARGFFRSVFSLVGLIAGVALAAWNGETGRRRAGSGHRRETKQEGTA